MKVRSETDTLRKVIVHEPDFGIEKVTPQIAEELLYDDIVYLPRMIEEHRIFTKSLKSFLGEENVLEIEEMLIEVLGSTQVKNDLLEDLNALEKISAEMMGHLHGLDAVALGKALIIGERYKEERINPLPNMIFTRDLGVAINDHFVICSANKNARIRESLISSYVFRYHPLFTKKNEEGKVIDLFQAFKGKQKTHSLEGGDMMIINTDHVFIGSSERTSDVAIHFLAKILLEKGVVSNVTRINMPPERYCMHLDTIFTVIDKDACMGFKPLMFEMNERVAIRRFHKSMDNMTTYLSVRELITDIYPDINCIPCGGGETPFQEREQWTDGSNLVTLKAGVFYGYERNYHTSEELKEHGYEVESALLLNDESDHDIEKIERLLITLPSGELSRARGGSHCMTLPIERD